jgi:hypothetical protein
MSAGIIISCSNAIKLSVRSSYVLTSSPYCCRLCCSASLTSARDPMESLFRRWVENSTSWVCNSHVSAQFHPQESASTAPLLLSLPTYRPRSDSACLWDVLPRHGDLGNATSQRTTLGVIALWMYVRLAWSVPNVISRSYIRCSFQTLPVYWHMSLRRS